jgi:GNAT superfamily N-acetyltransferase
MPQEFRKLNIDEMSVIYDRYMTEAFPPAELKPMSRIRDMSEAGIYDGYGLFGDGSLRAYGYFVTCPKSGDMLLDYLAVPKNYRGQGYGTKFLFHLPEIVGDRHTLIFEIEHPDKTDDPKEKEKRLRRKHFYLENGVSATEAETKVFGVDYQILQYMPGNDLTYPEVLKAVDNLYRTMFPEKWMGTKAIIYR